MGEEELKKEKMQVLYDYEETTKQLDARRAQAARMSEGLHGISEALKHHPENLFFPGDSVPLEFASKPATSPESLDADKIREICSAIRELNRRQTELSERKQQLGY
jgi:hypothetical protein